MMTDAQLLANRFDTRNMIGCSARATTNSKFFPTVVEIKFICIYFERPSAGRDMHLENFWGSLESLHRHREESGV